MLDPRSFYAIAAVLAPALPALGAQADPFAAGERWRAAPAAAAAWIPEEVEFAGDHAFVWAALRGGPDSVVLYDAVGEGAAEPRGVVPRSSNEFGVARIAAGSRGDLVYAVRQGVQPTTPAGRRRPMLFAYEPASAAGGAPLAVRWTYDFGVDVNATAHVDSDDEGRAVVVATWDDRTALAHVARVDGSTGAVLASTTVPAIGLDALVVSGDGARIALTAGLTLFVLDASLATLHTEALATSTHAVDLSGDGSVVAFGEVGALVALTDFGGFGYAETLRVPAGGPELPTRIALASHGTTMAVAWWNYANGREVRLELFDLLFGTPLASHALGAPGAAFQNLPIAAALSHDGFRAAFATWGTGGEEEVWVLEASLPFPVMAIDLPGSARALAFGRDGTRLAIAGKDVHAQTLGARGAITMVETGERSVALTGTPTPGGTLGAAARLAGATHGWFLVGPLAATPLALAGSPNPLLVDRARVRVIQRSADVNGRIDLALPIAPSPALVGVQLHVQAAFPSGGALWFSRDLASAYVLP